MTYRRHRYQWARCRDTSELESVIDVQSVKYMLKYPSVSLVVPTYQRGEILSQTLIMALSQNYPDFEVIVVDQSKDVPESVKCLVNSSNGLLKYIRLSTPNLPSARNLGVATAR